MPDSEQRLGSRKGLPPLEPPDHERDLPMYVKDSPRSTPGSPSVVDGDYHLLSYKKRAQALSASSTHSTPPASPGDMTKVYGRTRSFPFNVDTSRPGTAGDEEKARLAEALSDTKNSKVSGKRRPTRRSAGQDGRPRSEKSIDEDKQATAGATEAGSPVQKFAAKAGTPGDQSPKGKRQVPMPEINIAVLGARQVGKSSFVQRAFDHKTSSESLVNVRKMSLDGTIYLVRLFEICIDKIELLEDAERIRWPDRVDDIALRKIDGILALYDVTSQPSLARVPKLLNAMRKSSLPGVLVPCKCDNHPANRQVDPVVVEQKARSVNPDITSVQTARSVPQSQKQCMSVIIRAIIATQTQNNERDGRAARPRALTHESATSRSTSRKTSHTRAKSEHTGSVLKERDEESLPKSATTAEFSPDATSPRPPLQQQKSLLNLNDLLDGQQVSTPKAPTTPGVDGDEGGMTFEQLVDRLVSRPISKADYKFPQMFLTLYRKFAAPSELLSAILKRFKGLQHSEVHDFVRVTSGLRYLGVIERWVTLFPEDFSRPSIRDTLQSFMSDFSSDRIFAISVREIVSGLEVYLKDSDGDWPFHDEDESCPMTPKTKPALSEADTGLRTPSVRALTREISLTMRSEEDISEKNKPGGPRSGRSTINMASINPRSALQYVENAQRQSRGLVPNPRNPLSKVQWHQFMSIPDDAIARKLTQIDWLMFSSIRPRELVRHVCSSPETRRTASSLEHVDRMIAHFNHVAYWVTNIVMLRDKPKHRAIILEKLMRVARRLRELNNYNALGAVLAGISGTAVHRLSATRDLIATTVTKDFMKLEVLMGSQKSYFAYRLAWDNSSSERIPYIPLHRRDLVTAESGNLTFLPNGNINWKKFEIMGDTVLSLQKAQLVPYDNFLRNDEVLSILLETKLVKDEEELYTRSQTIEPSGSKDRRRLNAFFGR